MKTTIRYLKSGKIVVSERDTRELFEPGICVSIDTAEPYGDVGAEMCVGVVSFVSPDNLRSGDLHEQIITTKDRDGFKGNSNPHIKCLHGWRGTTNDRCTDAIGWRSIEESRPLARGHGWRTVFSADLCPSAK